ncbi:Clp protease N-terminal domain-containing protein [Streptomyces telluris]|uniref:Peptidase n=1 Tax=Streptomyces telluris TaxID=2720021 RepID=A0A9X2LIW1_9ACTN|nr:Clp protease N-terminal domain-containing protein [Streptomyces telluris]MCQ8771998.1 peptidase [Streptomyces telluris]NJP77269.1 peptidase [Streptomyces telluris]
MGDTGATDVAREGQFSAGLAAAVAGARRRAVRDGDRQTDTAHLLHTLMESDPEVCRAVDGGSPGRSVRLLGYLVQRTIGYGLRWSGTVEDSGSLPVLLGCRAPGWSPAAAAAMDGASARARARGDDRAEGTDLLAMLALDHRCRAAEVMRRAGVDTEALADRLGAAS